jgi:hypothetical protein
MRKNYQEAIASFNKSLYENPKEYPEKNHNTIGFYFMAVTSRYLNDGVKAAMFINKGLELQPNNFKLHELKKEVHNASIEKSNKKWLW